MSLLDLYAYAEDNLVVKVELLLSGAFCLIRVILRCLIRRNPSPLEQIKWR